MTKETKFFKVGQEVFWIEPNSYPARDILSGDTEAQPEHYIIESIRDVPDTCKWCGADMAGEDGSHHSIACFNGNRPMSRRDNASHPQQITIRASSGEILEFSPGRPIIFGCQHFTHV